MDIDGNEKETDAIDVNFELDEGADRTKNKTLLFYGEGSRMIENTIYNLGGGEGSYSRMVRLTWKDYDKVNQKKFRLRLYAKDINDDRIIVCGGGSSDYLVVQEYDISFIPTKFKSLDEGLTDDIEMKNNREPVAQINFDQFANIVQNGDPLRGVANTAMYFRSDTEKHMTDGDVYFKWPSSWHKSTYGYGYSIEMEKDNTTNYNYDVYLIASNTSQVTHHTAAGDLCDVSYYRQDKQGNTNPTKGFFFWINSASDPCVAANLTLGQLCVGSSIHVSAYMVETSNPMQGETGNISFNFMAVDSSGNKTHIHTYNTGYLPSQGSWYNIQYDFVPDYKKIADIPDIDHFEMQLENNCKNSESADYAIDEIQLFVISPEVKAQMMNLLCDEEASSSDVKVSLTYDQFLAAIGMEEDADGKQPSDINVYYTFLKKDVFDKFNSNYPEAYDAAVLKYKYDPEGEDGQTYGKLTFTNHFVANMPENPKVYHDGDQVDDSTVYPGQPYYEVIDGMKYVVMFIVPESKDNFVARQEYYVGLKLTDMEEDPINGDLTNFDLLNGCSHKGTFKIESANDTKIQPEDGSSYDTADDEFCVGTSPTVTIDVNAISADSKVELNKDGTDASIDWFAGSVEEFNSAMSADGILLSDAMAKFRVAYPDLSKPEDVQPNGIFTSPMKEYLVKLAKTRHIDGRPMLSFASLKYDFKPGKLIATLKDSLNYVTALPYLINEKYEAEEYTFCDAPIEVKFKVSANGPTMFHGLDMQYPDELIDVPIRIGMHQIEKAADDNNMLRVPVLKVSTPSTLATRLKLRDILNQNEVPVLLLESNDPAYIGRVLSEDSENDEDVFLTVGHVVKLDAKRTETMLPQNAFYVKFDQPLNNFYDEEGNKSSQKFEFHEGFYYTMKFDFEETDDAGTLEVKSCPASTSSQSK